MTSQETVRQRWPHAYEDGATGRIFSSDPATGGFDLGVHWDAAASKVSAMPSEASPKAEEWKQWQMGGAMTAPGMAFNSDVKPGEEERRDRERGEAADREEDGDDTREVLLERAVCAEDGYFEQRLQIAQMESERDNALIQLRNREIAEQAACNQAMRALGRTEPFPSAGHAITAMSEALVQKDKEARLARALFIDACRISEEQQRSLEEVKGRLPRVSEEPA